MTADVDGDGHEDLAADTNGIVSFEPGVGDGRFHPARALATGHVPPARLLLGQDYDGDGRSDLAQVDLVTGMVSLAPLGASALRRPVLTRRRAARHV